MQLKTLAPLVILLGSSAAQSTEPEATCSRSLPGPVRNRWTISGIRNWTSAQPEAELRSRLGGCGTVRNWTWVQEIQSARAEFRLDGAVNCVVDAIRKAGGPSNITCAVL